MGDEDELAEMVEKDGATLVAYKPLVRPTAARPAALGSGQNGDSSMGGQAAGGGINYKAFRKGGSGSGGVAAAPRVLMAFDPEPYQEAAVNADAFMK